MSESLPTIRDQINARRDQKNRFQLDEAAQIISAICQAIQPFFDRGERLFVHPSAFVLSSNGRVEVNEQALADGRDRACTPPELPPDEPGDARAAVYSIGAILYEMLTGESVGPQMLRPKELNPSLPDAIESLLGRALDPTSQRPSDLKALAHAIEQLATVQQPSSPLEEELAVDVRFSLLPIPAVPPPSSSPAQNPTAHLAELKARLESDPRPRYTVNKDKMDHGPFSAVELLLQIANGAFGSDDLVHDSILQETRPIREWSDFSPFAYQTTLRKEIAEEAKEIARVEKAEKKAGKTKYAAGGGVLLLLIVLAGVWFVQNRATRHADISVQDDPSLTGIDISGGIAGEKRKTERGGGFGGLSYEAAMASSRQEIDFSKKSAPDLTNEQLAAPMKNVSFIAGCGAPSSMRVQVRIAIQKGRAIGVTVKTEPTNATVAACIDRSVRGLSWPSHPKMDSLSTTY